MSQRYNIFSVEDDIGLFELIALTLKKLPVDVHHAKSGAEALELIPKMNVDVLILDITLPDMHGWDVLKELSALKVPLKGVIILTGHTESAHRVMAHFQDVTAYINKPFKPAELRNAIRTALSSAP